jgi:hypothetical protein
MGSVPVSAMRSAKSSLIGDVSGRIHSVNVPCEIPIFRRTPSTAIR